MPTIQELREKRGTSFTAARALLDKANAEKREMTTLEAEGYDKAMGEFDSATAEIATLEQGESRRKRIEDAERLLASPGERRTDPGNPGRGGSSTESREVVWKIANGEERRVRLDGRRSSNEYRENFEVYLANGTNRGLESRDLSADSPVDGGYLLAPTQMLANILKGVDDLALIRQFATVYQVRNSQSLGVPTLDTDVSDADWTTEVQTGTKDTSMKRMDSSRATARISPSAFSRRARTGSRRVATWSRARRRTSRRTA